MQNLELPLVEQLANFQYISPFPAIVNEDSPMTKSAFKTISSARKTLKDILSKKDNRFIMIVGPCSVHDTLAGFDYAKRLKELADKFSDVLYIVMRTYFEKPRTTTGWKGYINDPYLNESYNISAGIRKARQFLLAVNELGLPVATEFLNPSIYFYIEDLISWGAIGARTVESQIHREVASASGAPIGFKNSTDGSIDSAINAIISSSKSHTFIGTNNKGTSSVIKSIGNKYGHLVLRGGNTAPNYSAECIKFSEERLKHFKLSNNIIVDCSHANSLKEHKRQRLVIQDIMEQIAQGNESIVGAMLESNLNEGNQSFTTDNSGLAYGVSITDSCIGWDETEEIIGEVYSKLSKTKRFMR